MNRNRKRALITGVVGQDGSYLAELLLTKGYYVHGVTRRASYPHTQRIDHLFERHDERDPDCPFRVTYADLTDSASLRSVIEEVQPDEIYNLAAQSHVGISFVTGESTLEINALGPFRILDMLRSLGAKNVRYYQASSSEMFGASPPPQNETTPFLPQSPYGVSKVAAYHLTRLYRIAYGMFAANGILFNHESPRRGINFVTRKITKSVTELVSGKIKSIQLGNLDAQRDWGFSGDYVEGIWRILQHDQPDDFVIATGESYSIKDFLSQVFSEIGLEWQDFVEITDRYKRPAEVPALCGDATKARRLLGWRPTVQFPDLCRMMLVNDLAEAGLSLDEARRRAAALKRASSPTIAGSAL